MNATPTDSGDRIAVDAIRSDPHSTDYNLMLASALNRRLDEIDTLRADKAWHERVHADRRAFATKVAQFLGELTPEMLDELSPLGLGCFRSVNEWSVAILNDEAVTR